jgi:hypothetical protein
MAHFKLRAPAVVTGSTANAFITLVGLKFANTAGHRGRLRKLIVGGAAVSPQDVQVSLRLRRTDNTTDGTSTSVNVNTIGQADPNSIASNLAAIGKNYSAEPTTFATGMLGVGALNSRGTLVMEWGPDEAPIWGPNQTLCLEAAPGSATATTLDVTEEWEEF